jgi:hypothetical protein
MNFCKDISIMDTGVLPVSVTMLAACITTVSVAANRGVHVIMEHIANLIHNVFYSIFDRSTSIPKRFSNPWSHRDSKYLKYV